MFTLTIPVSTDDLSAIKADLTRSLPDVKSSHRCEAIARGLGFRTYATALAAVQAGATSTLQVRGDLFVAYLAEHAFAVSPAAFYHAAAKVALRDVLERTPKLTMWGIGVDMLDLDFKLREPRIHFGEEVNVGVLPFRRQALKLVLRGIVGGGIRFRKLH